MYVYPVADPVSRTIFIDPCSKEAPFGPSVQEIGVTEDHRSEDEHEPMIVTNQVQVSIPPPETATRQPESNQVEPDPNSADSRYHEDYLDEFVVAGCPTSALNTDQSMTGTTLTQDNTTEVSVPSMSALTQQESGQARPNSISDDNEHSKDSTNKSGEAVGTTDHSLSMVPPHPSKADISHNVQKQPMDTKPWRNKSDGTVSSTDHSLSMAPLHPRKAEISYNVQKQPLDTDPCTDTINANVRLDDEIGFSFPPRPPSPPDPPSSIWEEDSDQTNRKEPCNQPTQEEYPIMSTASVTPSTVGITFRTLDEVSHEVISSSASCYDSHVVLNYAAAARENTYVFSDSSLLSTREDSSWGTDNYTADGDLPNMSEHSHWRLRGPVEDTDESTGSHLGEPSYSGHQVSRSTSGRDNPHDASSSNDIQDIGDYASGFVSTTLSVIVDPDDSGITTENRVN